MKNSKKLFSVLLALTLILALGSQAFAAGTITVMDDGQSTYAAYKIFDAAEDGGDVSYTLAADSAWKNVLIDENGDSKFDGLTFTFVEGDPNADPATADHYIVANGNTFSAADFADFLRGENDANLEGKPSVGPFNAGTASDPLGAGYYLVISKKDGANEEKAALTTVLDDQNVNIQNKNDMPFEKENDKINGTDLAAGDRKEAGVSVGDTVSFKITGKVPAIDDDETTYLYLISDKMDDGLTFAPVAITVEIGGTSVPLTTITDPSALLGNDEVRYEPYANGKSFELSLNLLPKGKYAEGADIVVTYTATVNEKAAGKVVNNKAVLEYGNNPQNLTVKDSESKVYTSKLIIDKYETGNPEQKLAGAQFVLKNADGKFYAETYKTIADVTGLIEGTDFENDTDNSDIHYVLENGERVVNNIDWVDAQTDATVMTTASDGSASFVGLPDGSYQLEEIAAPAGYTKLSAPINVTIDGSRATAVGLEAAQITQLLTNVSNVENTPGTTLPSTGGIGTTIFYTVGAVLMVGAAFILIMRKRSEA